MATPQIGKIYDKNKIDQNKLNLFYDFYIKGFLNIYNFYARNYKNKIMFFYPSSIHVNKSQNINSEYIMIKRLGEEICSSLNRKLPNHKILILKIKPLLTDQHLSFYKSQNLESPIKYIFSIMKKIKFMKI